MHLCRGPTPTLIVTQDHSAQGFVVVVVVVTILLRAVL
jgi:hypothetical protein